MKEAFVKNTADKRQVQAAKSKVRSARDIELNDLRSVLNHKEGRRFIWRYLGLCGVFKLSFTGNSETFFNEGQRNIGLKLISDIHEASPEAYLLMMKESEDS